MLDDEWRGLAIDGGGEPSRPAPPLVREALDRALFEPARPVPPALAAGVVLALMMHASVAAALLLAWPEPLAGGGDLEAISVEVALVSAVALESRTASRAGRPGAAGEADAVEGAAASSAADAEQRPPEAVPPAPEPPAPAPATTPAALQPVEPVAPADPTATPPPVEAPPQAAPAPPLATASDPSPPDPEAPALAPLQLVEAEKLEAEAPPPPRRKPKPEPARTPAASPPGAVAQQSGGAASRAASPAAVQAFTRSVVEALARTRPDPRKARARGTVRIAFTVGASGGLDLVGVAASSGSAELDEAALGAVRKASFPAPPPGMSDRQRTYEVPYHFR